MLKKILLGLLILFVIIQAIRPVRNTGNAFTDRDIAHTVRISDSVQGILQRSCYDCHANHTNYPWYANINPVGFWLADHVKEGKKELNFSEFGTYSKKRAMHKMEEIVKQLQKKEMPLESYLLIHGDAKLSEAEENLLILWASEAKEEIALKQGN